MYCIWKEKTIKEEKQPEIIDTVLYISFVLLFSNHRKVLRKW